MGGFFGTISKSNCVADLFYGTDYNSHLGTRRAGMATYSKEKGMVRSIHNIEGSYFRSKFEDGLHKFDGATSGIGVISDTDAQPIIIHSHLGKMAIVTVARLDNLVELEAELLKRGHHFTELSSGKTNQTEVIATLINEGKTLEEGIQNMFNHIKGSCSLLILREDGVYAVRDKLGRSPIVIGKKDGAFAVSSETTAFPNLDYAIDYYVGPGEIIKLTADGWTQIRKPNDKMQVCSFFWIYFGFPCSSYEGINVEDVRFKCGEAMGKTDNTEADFCCGIPDSGVGMAFGYAAGHGIPYKRAISKYTPTWPRSFTPRNQDTRALVAKMKLITNKEMLHGKRVLFCDDSIVRGTQLKDKAKELVADGAKEVHMRIACPPLFYSCPFLNFTSSKGDMELITRQLIQEFEGESSKNIEKYVQTGSPEYNKVVDTIANRLSLTTLKYSTIEDLVESIGLPKCQLCTHCFDGSSKFTLEEVNLEQ